jgi:hypothetical protein
VKNIQTEILINADISKVWNVLMDFKNYPNWNPFIQSIRGEQQVGSKLTVFIKPPDSNGMTFKPKILVLEPNEEFRWKGKLGIKGIFDGEHYFILEPLNIGQTKLTHGEKFSGLLVSLMGKMLEKTKQGFLLMNESIKRECEKK